MSSSKSALPELDRLKQWRGENRTLIDMALAQIEHFDDELQDAGVGGCMDAIWGEVGFTMGPIILDPIACPEAGHEGSPGLRLGFARLADGVPAPLVDADGIYDPDVPGQWVLSVTPFVDEECCNDCGGVLVGFEVGPPRPLSEEPPEVQWLAMSPEHFTVLMYNITGTPKEETRRH